ncbi:MAG TPA: zinc-binding alcohol dehydrogenase [Methylomirabilota bacterium]|nr:zinc-binding alcohol dehydrogenase [Methylomirabilota bacterium]
MALDATALWIEGPGRAALRAERLPPAGPGEVRIAMLFSAISRGTEKLVFQGRVPPSEHRRMRCPFQEGDFPGPVKYGYAAVGRVEQGPPDLAGRIVFALAPHASAAVLPAAAVVPLPEGVPPRRAALAANMETALNVVWDARIQPGDRVAVFGAGLVGLLVARLAAAIPATAVTISDVDPAKAAVAATLGLPFTAADASQSECDVAINASASQDGLAAALAAAGDEATVVEASWYGEATVSVPLGGPFHSRRLRLVSSQVGMVPPDRRVRWTHRRRLETALALLADPALDALITGETPFAEAAERYAGILADPATLAHIFRY